MSTSSSAPEALVAEVERRLEEIEAIADPAARQTATEIVQALLELYGEGLDRIVGEVAARDEDGAMARALAADDLALISCCCMACIPLPSRIGCGRPWPASGRTWSPTAATSSSSRWARPRCTSASGAAAAGAHRRP
jgi:hypothetical protein